MFRLLVVVLVGWFASLELAADDMGLVSRYGVLPSGVRLERKDVLLLVLVKEQRMVASIGLVSNHSYRISTALSGIGARAGSGQTPPGWHRVHSRFGGMAPIGQVFRSRRAVPGEVLSECEWRTGAEDKVLSRVLWLEGLEIGVNKDHNGNIDSFLRHIYIHGTNREQALGSPASHGCIRMGNKDIVELYDLIRPFKNVYVYVEDGSQRSGNEKNVR